MVGRDAEGILISAIICPTDLPHRGDGCRETQSVIAGHVRQPRPPCKSRACSAALLFHLDRTLRPKREEMGPGAQLERPSDLYPDAPWDQAKFIDPTDKPMPIQTALMTNGLGQLAFERNGWTIELDSRTRQPLKFDSFQYFNGVAIISMKGEGAQGFNVINPPVQLLARSQVI